MQQVANRSRPEPAVVEVPPAAPTRQTLPAVGESYKPAGRKIHRVTVDLDDAAYRLLRRSALDWFVTGSALMRALVAEMAENRELAERIRRRAQAR
jgi:hypothetical protein